MSLFNKLFKPSDAANKSNSRANSISQWLTQLNLSQYTTNFNKHGFHDLNSIRHMDSDTLEVIGIIAIDHQAIILSELKKLNNFEEMTKILLSNDLEDLSHSLNQNIDIDTIRQDLKFKVDAFCSAMQFNNHQTKQFKKLLNRTLPNQQQIMKDSIRR